MATNVIELAPGEVVEGFAISQGSPISYAQLVERFGTAYADYIVRTYGSDSYWIDYGGSDFGGTYIETTYITDGGSPASVTGSGSALDLAETADIATSDFNVTPIAQGALGGGALAAQKVTLLSLDVGTVAGALAPLLGVAIGAGIYSINPEFWTKLSQKLLPFCYPGTTEIPGWLEIVQTGLGTYESHTIVDKRILDDLKKYFEDEGIKPDVHKSSIPYVGSVEYTNYLTYKNHPASYDTTYWQYGSCKGVLHEGGPGGGLFFTWYTDQENEIIYVGQDDGNPVPIDVNYHTWTMADGRKIYTTNPGWSYVGVSSDAEMTGNPAIVPYDLYYDKGTFLGILFGGTESSPYIPEGTTKWNGDRGSTESYSKPILYVNKDPENPGQFRVIEKDGVEIAVPEKVERTPQTSPIEKPEDWPEGEPYPMEIPFPWPNPDPSAEWPETMPWPLPSTKPDWWPDELPYPSTFPMPSQSVDPSANPNPNQNEDPVTPTDYAETGAPSTTQDPSNDDVPAPVTDPTLDPPKPGTPVDTSQIPPPSSQPPKDTGTTPIPVAPTIPVPFSSANDGLISVYNPTDAQLKSFASWLWVTYADTSIEKLWNNPFDGVISLMEIYCTPTVNGSKTIRSGFLDSGISSNTISRYTSINCGSITIPEYFGNYLDYSPYSKAHIYLPFVGIVELNVDDIVGHAVNVSYKIDEYNGSCIAQITVAKVTDVNGTNVEYNSLCYQFSGNCAVELPLAGGTQAAIRAAMMQAAAYGLSSAIGGIASGVAGNISGAISQLGYGGANAVGALTSAKSSVQHSGSFGSSYGALGIKIPYIIVSRPKQIIVPSYNTIYGYPAHKMVTIGACDGYLRCREVHVLSSTASDEEKGKIEELLKEGVYV